MTAGIDVNRTMCDRLCTEYVIEAKTFPDRKSAGIYSRDEKATHGYNSSGQVIIESGLS